MGLHKAQRQSFRSLGSAREGMNGAIGRVDGGNTNGVPLRARNGGLGSYRGPLGRRRKKNSSTTDNTT